MTLKPIVSTGIVLIACLWFTRCESQTPQNSNAETTTEVAEKKSIVAVLKDNANRPIDERIVLFYSLKKESPNGYDFDNEEALNLYGYNLLWEDKTADAIEVFKLVVAEFPGSANAYDSLGEAYLANGDSALSLVNYEKALAMNPDNFGAEDQIFAIKNPDYKPPKPLELFVTTYTPEEYMADLDQLGNTISKVHPAAFKFISEKDFWENIEAQKASITKETTFAEFAWMCSNVVASIQCSHSGTGWFYLENEMLPKALRFPLQTRLVNDKLYVIDPLNNGEKVKVKDEIVRINGRDVSEIVAEIYKHISSQAGIETTKSHVFNYWSSPMIAYALAFPERYTVEVKGREKPILLNKSETITGPYPDASIPRHAEELHLEFLENHTAVLSIASFNYYHGDRYDVFTKFMDESFAKINKKKTQNLMIDLRSNGGGSPESAVYLLQYISDKPFLYYSESGYRAQETQMEVEPFDNAFRGQCYFVIDGMGNSTTGHFMSMVKLLELGPIVGEELGSNQFCTGGRENCRLSNTKFNYYLGNNNNKTTATHLPDDVGILPDYYVSQDIDGFVSRTDTVRNFTIDLIKKAP